MKRHFSTSRAGRRSAQAAGFTLVEMLVSVALVVLMMSLFASVFQIVSQSVGTQRGLAENDQRARSVITILRGDLANRTFESIVPYHPSEASTPFSGDRFNFGKRQGYFYISENDLDNDADDVLQFTIKADVTGQYYGKASTFSGISYLGHPNQPDADDGNLTADSTSRSGFAEVAYFLRSGKLYRRVLLIREPSDPSTPQPTDSFGTPEPLFDPARSNSAAYTGDFWNDYDFSAYATSTTSGATFAVKADLSNDSSGAAVPDLGHPKNRFGHFVTNFRPREYVGGNFIGRFTHEETSHPAFGYPQRASNNGSMLNGGNPLDMTFGGMNAITFNTSTGVVDEYQGGPRRSEDLLLSNVHSFDIKVWDEALGKFADVGHAETDSSMNPIGDFNQNQNQHPPNNLVYGPHATAANNRVFDTWNMRVDVGAANFDNDGGGVADDPEDPPPFRPMRNDPFDSPDEGIVPVPLRAIQITVRYLDQSSDQFRQLTIVQSLLP